MNKDGWFWPWTFFIWFVIAPLLILAFPFHFQPEPACGYGPFVCLFFDVDWAVVQTVLNGWLVVFLTGAIYLAPLYVLKYWPSKKVSE